MIINVYILSQIITYASINNKYKEKGKEIGFISIQNILEIDFLNTYLEYYKSYYQKLALHVSKN